MRLLVLVLSATVACSQGAPDPRPPGDRRSGDPEPAVPPIFTIELSTEPCPELSPCGGSLIGTWHMTAACVEQTDLLGELTAWCPEAVVDGFSEQDAQGLLVFDDTSVYRELVAVVTAEVRIPETCGTCDCAAVEQELSDDEVTATCGSECNPSSECACSLRSRLVARGLAAYQLDGSTFVTQNSTFAYCVDGDTLTYVDASDPIVERGLYTLTRQ